MGQQYDDFEIPVLLTGTVGKYERVTAAGAQAGLTDIGIGVAQQGGVSGETITVRLYKAPTCLVKVSEALAAGALVYSEAAGKVQDTAQATSYPLGYARQAATADGDVIEVAFMAAVGVTAAS